MIRPWKIEDKTQYIELMKLFIDERMGEFGIEFDYQEAERQFDLLFNNSEIITLVAEKGGHLYGSIAGVIGPLLFSKNKVMQEMVWYVRKEFRGLSIGIKLIRAFEAKAKELGCDKIMMIGMGCDNSNEFYIKDGYQLLQQSYLKEI